MSAAPHTPAAPEPHAPASPVAPPPRPEPAAAPSTTTPPDLHDVVVVGGGPAGLSAALVLARARRDVVVVDAGEPRNAPAAGAHGVLGQEGVPPRELLRRGRTEVEGYGGVVRDGVVTGLHPAADGDAAAGSRGPFRVTLADGSQLAARRVVVATGLVDGLPDLPGVRERWGRDVLHCPYCHGWEVRDRAVVVLATGPRGPEQALLWRQWSADVTLALHTAPDPSDDEWDALAARGIQVVDGRATGLVVGDDVLVGVRLEGGPVLRADAVVVATELVGRSTLLEAAGVTLRAHERDGHAIGSGPAAEPSGATAVPGLWVAGNVVDPFAQVVPSAAAGMQVAAAVNADLAAEDVRRAVEARRRTSAGPRGPRRPFSPEAERQVSALVLGDRVHGLG